MAIEEYLNRKKEDIGRLLVKCPDRPGIVSALSTFLYEHGGDIMESTQFSSDDPTRMAAMIGDSTAALLTVSCAATSASGKAPSLQGSATFPATSAWPAAARSPFQSTAIRAMRPA